MTNKTLWEARKKVSQRETYLALWDHKISLQRAEKVRVLDELRAELAELESSLNVEG